MSKGSVSNFTTTSSLPGASMESNEGAEITATRFGNFEVLLNDEGGLYLLGGGGFGKTYKARHVYLNQIVALKVINDRFLNDGSAKERFLREAQVVHQLRHPNIAHVIDFGEVKSALYYAMEFCGGGNLETMVSRIGPLPLPIMLRCARQLAEALGCAHSNGFIHRDVKPANIMLTGSDDTNPQLKLVDFGLVKHLQGGGSDATAALTMTGQQFFTIQFASPEQLMEEELDARSDLFALGMTLWFLVKGSPPETGSMASIVAKRLDARPYESLLPDTLPPAYRSLLARLLEKDRGQRFQNTTEFLAALDAAEAAPDIATGMAETAVADEDDPASDTVVDATLVADASTSVTAVYDVHENLGSMPLGVLYWATRKRDNEQVAITMVSDALREDPAQRAVIEGNVARLRAQPHETIARVYGLEEYQEGLALVQEWHQGVSLHSILKTARFLSYADALRVLLPIAQGTDWTTGSGLPGIVLAMDEIYLQPEDAAAYPDPEKLLETPLKNWPPFRVRLLPYVVREEASQDVGMTLNTEVVSDPTVAFGCLLYHLVAGHAPRAAAKLSKSAYVTIGRLAEDSNRLLASCIVNERDFGGCEGVLQSLSASEGVGFSSPPTTSTVSRRTTATGGGPIDLTRSRQQTGGLLKTEGPKTRAGGVTTNRVDLNKPATETGGKKGDTTGKSAVVQTKRITRTGGLGSVGGGPATARPPRDMAREAEETRLKQQEEEAAQARAQQEAEARRAQEAEEARLRQEQLEEERLRKAEAEEARIQRLAEEKRLREEQAEQARLDKAQADEARALKQAEEKALREQQAEQARLAKQQQAEQARFAKEQAEQARALKQAEETRLKQQQADEARIRKQQADEARAQKLAEDKRLKEEQAEQARLAKQQAEETRLQKLAEEKLLKQQQAEEAKAKKTALPTQKLAVGLTSRVVTHSLDQAEEPVVEEREQRTGLPPVVWVGAGGFALVAVAAAAFVFLHKPAKPLVDPKPTPPVVVDATPTPALTPVAQQPTVAPAPKEFAFLQGFKPSNAVVRLNGVTLKLTADGGKVLVPLSGAAPGDSLTVEARGYEPKTFPITGDMTEKSQVVLHRQQGVVRLVPDAGRCDYSTAVFKALSGLPGEQSNVQMSKDDLAVSLANGTAEPKLDTGIYQVTLLGPGGTSDPKLQPYILASRLSVTDHGVTLPLQPSFAGRYDFRFAFLVDPTRPAIEVERSVVIDPGLENGHVDDRFPNEQGAKPALDTKITDITIDSTGKLHGRIRYSLRPPNDPNMSYDEQMELSYVDGHFVIVSGGWEVAPTDAAVAKALQKAMPKNYSIHMQPPPPRTVQKK